MMEMATLFKKNKLKLTPQRLAIYNFLKSTKTHPSADEIYKSIYNDYPTMSLATVYKTLKTLVDVRLVDELNLGEGNFRYDCSDTPHSHFFCNKCNKIEDIELSSLQAIRTVVEKETKNKIDTCNVYLFGTCKKCLNKS